MKRILVTTDAVGGVWRYSLELCAAWCEGDVQVVLAVLGPPARAIQQQEAASVPGLVLIHTGLGLDWTAPDAAALQSTATALADLADKLDVESVHLHAPALVGTAPWPVPVVAMVHSCLLTWWRAMRTGAIPADFECRVEATRRGLRTVDAVAAPSGAFAEEVRTAYELGRTIEAVHNGRRPLALPNIVRRPGVLATGRLWDEAKNFAGLAQAAHGLPVRVTVAGETRAPTGGEVAFPHVHHAGNLDQEALARQLAGNSVFAGLAFYEPFGLSVLEAAQSGMALVLSDIPVFRELWDGAAIFVDPGGTKAVREGLLSALSDPTPLARRAAARAADYSRERMADATLALHAGLHGIAAAA